MDGLDARGDGMGKIRGVVDHTGEWASTMRQLILLLALAFMGVPMGAGQGVELLAKPVPVVVLCNGDDGLTLRLCDAVKHALEKAPDFRPGVTGKPHFLTVRIPTNVDWKRDGKRALATYSVEIAMEDGRVLRRAGGSCWESRLGVCAAGILAEARRAVGVLQP